MALPRELIAGSTYVLTRHCTRHIPLLALTAEVRQTFLYILGTALADWGVRLHAFVVLPNCWRAVFTDVGTEVPRFTHSVHRRSALRLNRILRRRENLWSSERYSLQRLETGADVLEAMVETMAWPVELGYVDDLDDWCGLVTKPEDFLGRGIRVRRPAAMARVKGAPERTCIRHKVPKVFRRRNKSSWVVKLRALVANRVDALGEQARTTPQPPPADPPPATPAPRPQDTPHTFVRSACTSIRAQKHQQHLDFQSHYRTSLAHWRIPDRRAVFPYGTFWMRVFHKACCADSPPGVRAQPRS